MPLARKYYTVNGEIISELRAGETHTRDYVRDALGNVVAIFQNDWEIALATYDTSGEFLTNFNMSDSRFAWNGSHGYRSTGLEWSTHYVRARHYSFMDQAWTTRDPLWPQEMPYGYVNGRSTRVVDFWGMDAVGFGIVVCNEVWNNYIYNYCNNCYQYTRTTDCQRKCHLMASKYYDECVRVGKKSPYSDPNNDKTFKPPYNKRGLIAPRGLPLNPGVPMESPPRTGPGGFTNCDPQTAAFLSKVRANIVNAAHNGKKAAINDCIRSYSGRVSGLTCPEPSNQFWECMENWCRSGMIDCYPGLYRSNSEAAGNSDTAGCVEIVPGTGTPLNGSFGLPNTEQRLRPIPNPKGDMRSSSLTMIHEMAHKCGGMHGFKGGDDRISTSYSQCNDIYAYCFYAHSWG